MKKNGMPTARNTNNEIIQIGVLPELAMSTKSIPGTDTISATPIENKAIINPTKVVAPIMIKMTPINLAMTVNNSLMMSANVSKKLFELD